MPLLKEALHILWTEKLTPPFFLAGIHANERRMREYGTAGQPDYAGRGDLAPRYETFVITELLPYLQQRYPLTDDPARRTIAGFSLGALSALDIAWRNPDHFLTAGVFSGSLWWRSAAFDPDDPDANRIMHATIAEGPRRDGFRCWLQAGTEDETDDRNHNGIIDAIDDTLDLIKVFKTLGCREGKDIHYLEVAGGRHEPATWARVLPDFLRWVG